jgi:hypothetical protein
VEEQPNRPPTHHSRDRPVATESGASNPDYVRATVVARDDLDVFVARLSLAVLILDARIREVDVSVVVRQVVLASPLSDLLRLAVRSSVAILPAAIALVKKPLAVALQLVIQDHAIHSAALLAEALLGALVGAVDL